MTNCATKHKKYYVFRADLLFKEITTITAKDQPISDVIKSLTKDSDKLEQLNIAIDQKFI